MDRTRKIFTDRLAQASETSKVSQAEISRILKTTPNTVNRWFKGKNWPEPETIDQLAEILDVSPQWLFGAEEADKSKDRLIIELIEKAQSIRTITGLQAALEALDAIREGESLARQETLSSEKKKA